MTDNDDRGDGFFRDARRDMTGPLEGIRVVEITTTWAGPRCGALLADYGAEVVKLELRDKPDVARRLPPMLAGTEPLNSFCDATVNRNKQNVTVDLRQPAGQQIFRRLAEGADVIVENFRPGVLAQWNCGYDDVRRYNSSIVYVSISGFGQFGPYHQRPGYDPMAQCLSGFMWLNGVDDGPPQKAPVFLADELAALHGAMSAMAALRHRDRTSEGQHIDVSLLDAMTSSMTGLLTIAASGEETPRLGSKFSFAAPSDVYRCRDGWVYAGVLLDAHWKRLAVLLGCPELADHPDYATITARVQRRAEVDELLGGWCAQQTRAEVVAVFAEHGLTAAAVLSPAEATEDPHQQARGTLGTVTLPSGESLTIEGPAAKMSRTPIGLRSAARDLGADTDEVLKAVGFDQQQLDEWRAAGVI